MSVWFLKEVVNQERGPPLFLNKNDNVIGRKLGAFIRLNSSFASRHHCTIRVNQDDKAFLIDHKTLNGTYIGVDKIPTDREIPLIDGDCIGIGLAANEFSPEPYFILYKTEIHPEIQDIGEGCDATQVYPNVQAQPDSTNCDVTPVTTKLDSDDTTFTFKIPQSRSSMPVKAEGCNTAALPECSVVVTKLNFTLDQLTRAPFHTSPGERCGTETGERNSTADSVVSFKQEADTSKTHEYSMCDDIILIESDEDENDLPCSQLFNSSRRNDRRTDPDGSSEGPEVIEVIDDDPSDSEADLLAEMIMNEIKAGRSWSEDQTERDGESSQMSPETYMMRVNNVNSVEDAVPLRTSLVNEDLLACLMTQKDSAPCHSSLTNVIFYSPVENIGSSEKHLDNDRGHRGTRSTEKDESEASPPSECSKRKKKKSCDKSGSRKSRHASDCEKEESATAGHEPRSRSPPRSSPSLRSSKSPTCDAVKQNRVKHGGSTPPSRGSPINAIEEAGKKLKKTLSARRAVPEIQKTPYGMRPSEKRTIRETRKLKLKQMALKKKEEKSSDSSDRRDSPLCTKLGDEGKKCFVKNTETNRGAILIDSIPRVMRKRNTSGRYDPDSKRKRTSKEVETVACDTRSTEADHARGGSEGRVRDVALTDDRASSGSVLKKRQSDGATKSVSFARPDSLTSVKYFEKEGSVEGHGADSRRSAAHKHVYVEGKPLSRDQLLFIFLKWNPRWIEESVNAEKAPPLLNEEFPSPSPVSVSYTSYAHYQNTQLPLQVSELWQSLVKDLQTSQQCHYEGMVREVQERRDGMLLVNVCSYVMDSKTTPKRGDLVIVRSRVQEDGSSKSVWLSFGFIENWPVRKPLQHSDPFSLSAYRTLSGNTDDKFCRQTFSLNLQVTIRPKRIKFWNEGLQISILPCYNLNVELKLLQTLERLVFSPLAPVVLDPTLSHSLFSSFDSTDFPFKRQVSLNEEQMCAVNYCAQTVLHSKPSLVLVHGPPGTGKSVTITHLLMTVLEEVRKDKRKTRLLLCAPSNCAVDHLVSRLLHIRSTMGKRKFNMVRVGNFDMMSEEAKHVSLTTLSENSLNNIMNNTDAVQIQLEALEQREKYLMSLSTGLTDRNKQKNFADDINDVRRYSRELRLFTAGKADSNVKTNLMKRYERELLLKADIVATTLSSCNCAHIERHLLSRESKPFGCCIIDEASQATELQTLSPTLLGVDKIILVGDHKQLPPVIVSQQAKNDGLEVSLFERLYNCWKDKEGRSRVICLKKQYRMQREIAAFPNRVFYNGSLLSMDKGPHPAVRPYLVLSHTFLQDHNMDRNSEEGRVVVSAVQIIKSMSSCSSLSIAVITPYQSQRQHIAAALSKEGLMKSVSVMTIDSAQGQEADVVVVSCVKTHSVRFLTDPNRLNVALTRAKQALILIGNFDSLKENQLWKDLLEDARKRGVLQHIGSVPSVSLLKRFICHEVKQRTGR